MKKSLLTCIATIGMLALPAVATANDRLIIMATERSTGSMTMGSVVAYNKSFDLVISNGADEALELSDVCLEARTSDGKSFGLDTVDEALTTGTLASGDSTTGFATFASDNSSVLNAVSVHAKTDC